MKRIFHLTVFFLISVGFCSAQVSNRIKIIDDQAIMPKLDNISLNLLYNSVEEDISQPRPLQFAHPFDVNISDDIFSQEIKEDGTVLLSFHIISEGALSINLGFDRFDLPPTAEFYLKSSQTGKRSGPFVKENKDASSFWSPIIEGDELTMEVICPANDVDKINLLLSKVNHDFYGLSTKKSGACNVDVVCSAMDGYPEIDARRDIIRSSGVYSIQGTFFCSGALINTANNSCEPYFLTANHCISRNNFASSVVVYWNFENSTCRAPGSGASGGNGDGNLDVFSRGVELLETNEISDYSLIELDEVPEEANAFLSGWNRERNAPQEVIAVHHPNTDEKRISFEFDPLSIADYLSDVEDNSAHFLRVDDWDIGTTEGGSSGSPLYNTDNQIVGQLSGGFAACGNDRADWYGLMASNFELTQNSIESWLDPESSGDISVNGQDYNRCGQISVLIEELTDGYCNDSDSLLFRVINLDQVDASLSAVFVNQPSIVEYLPNSTLNAGDTTYLRLAGFENNASNEEDFTIILQTSSGDYDYTEKMRRNSIPQMVSGLGPSSGSVVGESVSLSWASNGAATYRVRWSKEDDFNNSSEAFTSLTRFELTGLQSETIYYVDVTGINSCGIGASSAAIELQTIGKVCRTKLFTINGRIDDNATVEFDLELDQPGRLIDLAIVDLNIEHDYLSDLIVSISDDYGNESVLLQENCNDQVNYQSAFYDGGNTIICPPQEDIFYNPFSPFNVLVNKEIHNKFTLSIEDLNEFDEGFLQSIELGFCFDRDTIDGFLTTSYDTSMYEYDTLGLSLAINTQVLGEDNVSLAIRLPVGMTSENYIGNFDENPREFNLVTNGLLAPGSYEVLAVATSTLGTDTISINIDVKPCVPASSLESIPDTLRRYYYDFKWNDLGADAYRLMLSDNAQIDQGLTYDEYLGPNIGFRSNVLPSDTKIYAILETAHGCVMPNTISIDSFYTSYDYSIVTDLNTYEICSYDTAYVILKVGQNMNDSFDLQVIGNPGNDFEIVFDENGLKTDNEVQIMFIPGQNSPRGLNVFSAIVSDSYIFNDEIEIEIDLEESVLNFDLIQPAQNAVLINGNDEFIWKGTSENTLFELSLSDDFSTLEYSADVSGMESHIMGISLADTTQYYWRVLGSNRCASSTSTFFGFISDLKSSSEEIQLSSIKIFPNPVRDKVSIFSENLSIDFVNIRDVRGVVLISSEKDLISLEHLTEGLYFIEIYTSKGSLVKKIFKE